MTPSIAGIAEFPQGKTEWPSTMALHEALVRCALEDAGLTLADVDVLYTVSPRSDPYLVHAAALAERLVIAPSYCVTFEAGGGAPVLMLFAAHQVLAAGAARTAVVVAGDLALTGVSRARYVDQLSQVGPVHPEFEVPYGPSVPSLFALVTRRYFEEYGTNEEDLLAVVEHDRHWAAQHANAHMRTPVDRAGYLASRVISDPLRLLDCAPVSDGGGAIVLTTLDRGSEAKHSGIVLLGVGASTSTLHLTSRVSLTEPNAGIALDRALSAAGLTSGMVDLALVYDCFSIAMLLNVEDMGLAPKGEAGRAFRAGDFNRGGRIPLNTHGGLLSHGHPARAGGMGNLIEAVVQLRHQAGARQVLECAVAIVHGMGGAFATHAVGVLARSDA